MSWAFEALGLARDADEMQIKRAYARKLKTTRPDSDPHAFQALNEAYQTALQHAQYFSSNQEEVGDSASSVEPQENDSLSPPQLLGSEASSPSAAGEAALQDMANIETPPRYFAFDAFFNELAAIARDRTESELSTWLNQHTELYELQLKAAVGDAVHDQLRRNELLFISEFHLQAIVDFFGFGIEPWLMERRHALQVIADERTLSYGELDRKPLRELKRPFQWPRALFMAMRPTFVAKTARLASLLHMDLNGWPSPLNREQSQFYCQLADPGYFGRWRFAVNGVRALIGAVAILLLLLIAAKGATEELLLTAGAWGLGLFVLFTAWNGAAWIKVKARNTMQRGNPTLQLVPCGLGVLALLLLMIPEYGAGLGGAVAAFSLLFHWQRVFQMLRFWLGAVWICGWLIERLLPTHPQSLPIIALAMIPILLTAFDALYARQHQVPLYVAAGNPWTQKASYLFLAGGFLFSFIFH